MALSNRKLTAADVDPYIKQLSEEIAGVNGGGLIKTAIIKGDHYDEALEFFNRIDLNDPQSVRPLEWFTDYMMHKDTFRCINMNYAEALEHIRSGGVLNIVIMMYADVGVETYHCFNTRYQGSIPYDSGSENSGCDAIYGFVWDERGAGLNAVSEIVWTADRFFIASIIDDVKW